MDKKPAIKGFPDVEIKLSAPTKKSVFERQKAEAEAKRLREEEETAAVYQDFVKSFDHDDEEGFPRSNSGFSGGLPGGFGNKRHFSGVPTGPSGKPGFGGKGSGPGSLGPAPAFSKKRTLNSNIPRDSKQGMFAFEDGTEPLDAKKVFLASDDEDERAAKSREAERAAARPTLHLSSLPPRFSVAGIKRVLPSTLKIENVRLLPPSRPTGTDRHSLSAIVTVAKDTPAIDLDTAVSMLSNHYLGWGYYLTLSRHLSSAAVSVSLPFPNPLSSSSLPFGAKPIPTGGPLRAPPPGSHRGGFAPPSSYAPSGPGFSQRPPPVQVTVTPPHDLKQLKLIHKTVENVITHGPEFEALLMTRPSVQREEKWAWLWDPRSVGGVWYRWRIWDVLTSAQQRIKTGKGRNDNASQFVFEGGPIWQSQDRALAFEYDCRLEDFVSDSEYDSSEDEDSGDEGRRRLHHLQGGAPPPDVLGSTGAGGGGEGPSYLNPLQKAKLVHLLARLPVSTGKLRRGDVARVTAFAIKNAGEGAHEVVELITRNVHSPFALSSASLENKPSLDTSEDPPDAEKNRDRDAMDPSSLKLIALYLISDILSSSSTSGVRHAWRYRQLFEASLRTHKTFPHLGRLEKALSWGRLRAEKWKRSVNGVLSLWEGWCVFPVGVQEEFKRGFDEPPMSEKEREEEAQRTAREVEEKRKARGGGRWRAVDEDAREEGDEDEGRKDVDGEAMDVDDVDGAPMEDEDDVDGAPMEDDEDVDGAPMDEGGDQDGVPMEEDADEDTNGASAGNESEEQAGLVKKAQAVPNADTSRTRGAVSTELEAVNATRMRRPKAEDMFADSDED